MEAAGSPPFDVVEAALDEFEQGGKTCEPFLLMLYDSGRMPFSERIPRETFAAFFREALERFPFTGTFEAYIFILEKIFGEGSSVLFQVPAPGKLEMLVNAASSIEFNFIVKEFVLGSGVESNLVDSDGSQITFRGISGIDSEYKLNLLLAEMIPAGIYPDVTLSFFSVYNLVTDENNSIFTDIGDQIIAVET